MFDLASGKTIRPWCLDNEGYGRSSKHRPINSDISTGADDLEAGSRYILERNGGKPIFVYGVSSRALKAALFAQRHPERVARLALDAFVWTGENSPTLKERAKRLSDFQSKNRRPIDRAFVHSIFNRDHPDAAEQATVDAFADAILTLQTLTPTGLSGSSSPSLRAALPMLWQEWSPNN